MMCRCKICHRILKDDVSVALGIGPECRNSKTKSPKRQRQIAQYHAKVDRTQSFSNRADIKVGPDVFRYSERGWTKDGKRFTSHFEFQKYLLHYGFIFPNDQDQRSPSLIVATPHNNNGEK